MNEGAALKWLIICISVLLLIGAGCEPPPAIQIEPYLAEDSTEFSWSATDIERLELSSFTGYTYVEIDSTDSVTVKIVRRCWDDNESVAISSHENLIIHHDFYDSVLSFSSENRSDLPLYDIEIIFYITAPPSVIIELYQEYGYISLRGPLNYSSVRVSFGYIVYFQRSVSNLHPIDLYSANGSIEMYLPDSASLSFNAISKYDEVFVNGFENVTYTINEINNKEGMIGDGGGMVSMETAHGRIHVAVDTFTVY